MGRTAHHQRRHGPDREGLPAARIGAAAGLERRERAVEPTHLGRPGLAEAAFEHVLSIEMRPVPVRRRDRMHDGGLAGLIEPVQVRHRRIERKEGIERERGLLALERERVVAPQLGPIGIADRRDRGEAVERTAQHDREEARVAAFGARDARHEGPGEQHARAPQQIAPGHGMGSCRHDHLR